MAELSPAVKIFISIASILAAFDISMPIDQAGNPVPPSAEYNTASVVKYDSTRKCNHYTFSLALVFF